LSLRFRSSFRTLDGRIRDHGLRNVTFWFITVVIGSDHGLEIEIWKSDQNGHFFAIVTGCSGLVLP
jgi:hypothetical protein